MSGEFSVYWWDAHGGQHEELRFVDAESAMRAIMRLTRGPAAQLGLIERVMISDGGDCCCFDWNRKDGVVFPREEKSHETENGDRGSLARRGEVPDGARD